MNVGIVGGTGPAGQALALRLAASGLAVTIGSRSKARAEEIAAELRAKWPSHDLGLEGAENLIATKADIVVLATPWDGAVGAAAELRDALGRRVVVAMVNALARVGDEFQALVPARGSIAASVQAVIPESYVAGAFHHLPARALANLDQQLVADVLVCGDERIGVDQTIALVEAIPGLRGVFAGSLASANAIEAMTAVLLNVNVHYKSHVAITLNGLREQTKAP